MRLRGEQVAGGCVQVVFSEAGQSRRAAASGVRGTEVAYGFHPGPYGIDMAPFAAAPETGLRIRFVIDAADPRVAQQRFDLYLFSEVAEVLTVEGLRAAVEAAVQEALAQGMLDLPPCTSLDEWNAFRAGLNQLLYTRFGITVEDCLPVDLGEQADYAAQLRARAQAPAPAAEPAGADPAASRASVTAQTTGATSTASAATGAAAAATATDAAATAAAKAPRRATLGAAALGAPLLAGQAADDAHALRRLFLELPVLSSGLRQVALPPGQALFLAHRSLLQRIALIALDVNTMPVLALAAPNQPLPAVQQQRRAHHSIEAARGLDQAWALLARLQLAANPLQFGAACGSTDPEPMLAALLDDADRIVSNLDHHLSQRRIASADARLEPSL
ncbi:hypothetical protein ASD15_28025 [Massilia sp. Root351]|nr:hypothetical protein ASD15_28025 [Massilia sp. Root351]